MRGPYSTLAVAHAVMFLMGPLFLRSSLGGRFGGVNWPMFITAALGTYFWLILIILGLVEFGIISHGWPLY